MSNPLMVYTMDTVPVKNSKPLGGVGPLGLAATFLIFVIGKAIERPKHFWKVKKNLRFTRNKILLTM